MTLPQEGKKIVVLLRALTLIGLVMVVFTLAQVGWLLSEIRGERAQATARQQKMSEASARLRQLTMECRVETIGNLDTAVPWKNDSDAVQKLAAFVKAELQSQPDASLALPLTELQLESTRIMKLATAVNAWRGTYEQVWTDLKAQRTMGKLRNLIDDIRNSVESIEGKRRLAEAIQYRNWRHSSGDQADAEAKQLLTEQANEQAQGISDFKNQLGEFARLVELLGGEEQFDDLADLKDNKFKPLLDRLRQSMESIADADPTDGITRNSVNDLETALFGKGYVDDEVHQNIQVGEGGLFVLRRDVLELRRQRDAIEAELAQAFQEIELATAAYVDSTHAKTVALTREMEFSLSQAWRQAFIGGCCCLFGFFWLSWTISRGVRRQVKTIEDARTEAEHGRHQTQALMLEQQAAAAKLAAALGELGASERRFRTLSAAAPIGIFEASPAGNVIYANAQWLETTGLSSVEQTGGDWLAAVSSDDAQRVAAAWRGAIENGDDLDLEFRLQQLAGQERWVSAHTAAIRSEAGDILGHVGTFEDITGRKQAEAELKRVNTQLVDASRQAGMAEVATGVLHNVGNVLNSVNISANVIREKVTKSRAGNLSKAVEMIASHTDDLAEFLTTDAKGRQLPGYFGLMAKMLREENGAMLEELTALTRGIEHIKQVVQFQQDYARPSTIRESLNPAALVEDALRINLLALERHRIEIVREFNEIGEVGIDRNKTLQILVNLISNAKNALRTAEPPEGRRITFRSSVIGEGEARTFRLEVIDNGVGIPPENLKRIFTHGFTTSATGHGFGLHSACNAAREMSGNLTVSSAGAGCGAAFTLEIPLAISEAKAQ
jgi:PAS domain S-box-containing protein